MAGDAGEFITHYNNDDPYITLDGEAIGQLWSVDPPEQWPSGPTELEGLISEIDPDYNENQAILADPQAYRQERIPRLTRVGRVLHGIAATAVTGLLEATFLPKSPMLSLETAGKAGAAVILGGLIGVISKRSAEKRSTRIVEEHIQRARSSDMIHGDTIRKIKSEIARLTEDVPAEEPLTS